MRIHLLLGILAVALTAAPAFAQTANSVITPQTPNNGMQKFVQGTDAAGTYKTVYTGATHGSICRGLIETNNDASATHLVTYGVNNSTDSTDYPLGAVTTASNDGQANSVPAKNLFASANLPGLPLDGNGNGYIYLKSGDKLEAEYATTLTSGDSIKLYAPCSDF